ncbi:glycosyltransferase [Pseudodesulfovibrio sp. zrk46]|uniref:CgeB family protein n=1 Tax=Pseudodesulfovibrio sp. zrk46 TaxID=2725288 RepID=UPI001448C4A8|nr:glycosyltransferase [Pseudodesulfovibrio sp. zrk46]QJB58118.1 glycosyltransferase [Pseudodesulfovibrio sp. zrk46]
MSRPQYTAEALTEQGRIIDIRIHINGKTWHLWGRNGEAREDALIETVPRDTLPVLLGSGLGHCLRTLVSEGQPVAVVDAETTITELTGLRKEFGSHPDVLWLDHDDPQQTINTLTQWQSDHGGMKFTPVALPLYLRLNRPYYGTVADTLKANATTDFWSMARYPKFQSNSPRVLFIDSSYFLCGEILSALQQLDIEHRTITLDQTGIGSNEFVEGLLKIMVDFRPDFVLTVNHFGLDREGVLAELLDRLQLPLASWFVDNPHLILHQYDHPGTANTAIFTYDAGNLDQMREKGFDHVYYLPLATDPERFHPTSGTTIPSQWKSDVSFVGNSMTAAVANSLAASGLPLPWHTEYEAIAKEFQQSGYLSIYEYLKDKQPTWSAILDGLPTRENKLGLESLITWEATRQYRLSCVRQLLPLSPLIVGDDGWKDLLADNKNWRHLGNLDYYEDLPHFYPASKINFNCTSRQMPGAVNQRVFDVPACGAFLLTDYREQMESLFEPETEVAVYNEPEEIPERIKFFLKNENQRKKIIKAARARILSEHTYVIRLQRILSTMKSTFGN